MNIIKFSDVNEKIITKSDDYSEPVEIFDQLGSQKY